MAAKISKVTYMLAAAVGIAAVVMSGVWSFDGLHPAVWTDTAVAAGLLPQDALLPGFGELFGRLIFLIFPADIALKVDVWTARIAVGLMGWMVYFMLSGAMRLAAGTGLRDRRRRTTAIRYASFVGALAFVFSDPIWTLGQGVSGALFTVGLIVGSLCLAVRFLLKARFATAMWAMTLTGLLAAESPLGYLVLALELVITSGYLRLPRTEAWLDFLDPAKMQRSKWALTFGFVAALVFGILAEMTSFYLLDGCSANSISAGELPVAYLKAYASLFNFAAAAKGYALFIGAGVVPALLGTFLISKATDEDHFLSFRYGVVFFLVAMIGSVNLFAWFVNLSEMPSHTLSAFSALLGLVSLSWGIYVLLVEVLCRDYDYVQTVTFLRFSEDSLSKGKKVPLARGNITSVKLSFVRRLILVVPLLVAALVIWTRENKNDRELMKTLSAFIDETLTEAEGTEYFFTDGALDTALRLRAYELGQELNPIAVLGGGSRTEAFIRQNAAKTYEDRILLEADAADTLRTWILEKPERLDTVAVQLAFELFALDRHLRPIIYGALVRPKGGDPEKAAESVDRAHALADRIVELHEKGVWRHASNALIKDRLLVAQFRLAVMSRLRAIALDREKKTGESMREIDYADRLNSNNPSLVKILRDFDWVKRLQGAPVTPREGLAIALKRPDFKMARRYAQPILAEDKDDPVANFAIGMSYYIEDQYAKAEEYLLRATKRNPDEPTIYNQLAMIALRTQRAETAYDYAVKAKALYDAMDESLKRDDYAAAIEDTIKQCEKAKASRQTIKPAGL